VNATIEVEGLAKWPSSAYIAAEHSNFTHMLTNHSI